MNQDQVTRLCAAIAAQTDALSTLIDEQRNANRLSRMMANRLTICAVAAFPVAIGTVIGGLLLFGGLLAGVSTATY